MEPSAKNGPARQGSSVLVISIIILVLNTAGGIVLARLLGPTGRGQLAAAILWPSLLTTVGSLGLYEAVVYFTASTPSKRQSVFGSAVLAAAMLAALLAVTWYVASPLVLGRYGGETVRASLYMVWAIPLGLLWMVTAGVLLGALDVGGFNRIRLASTAFTTLGLLALYILQQRSLIPIVAVYLAVGVFTLCYSLMELSRLRGMTFQIDLSLIRRMVSYGVRSHVGTVSNLANDRADQALISILLPATYLGLYSIAVTLPSVVVMIGSSLSTVALPSVTAAESTQEKERRLGQLVRTTLVLSTVAALTLSILTPVVIEVFFGSAFLPAATVAQVLLVGSVLFGVSRVTSAGLRAFNRPFSAGIGDATAAGVTVVSLGLLVPAIGLLGAAIASLLAYGANFIFNLLVCRWLGISLRELLIPTPADIRWFTSNFRQVPALLWSSLTER